MTRSKGGTAYIGGVGLTPFGRLEGLDTLDLMSWAANECLSNAGLIRAEVDGLVTGYSTTMPHLMLATLFAEHFGIEPSYCNGLALGGATGCAAIMLGKMLVESGQCGNVLVVAGENRLSSKGGRNSAIQTLAQVGHADFEVPYGCTIPGYYGLLASEYADRHGVREVDLAEVAVHMRGNAAGRSGAHLRTPVSIEDVMASKPIATPLKLLDCCPISDGAAAVLLTSRPAQIRITGAGQAHRHQHVSSIGSIDETGAALSAGRALAQAGRTVDDIDVLGIYDSFTITLTMLLEEIGFSARGRTGIDLREGRYDVSRGGKPMNGHGGLLSYGHSGVAGGMAHFVEVVGSLRGDRNADAGKSGFVHADGGVLSSHVSIVLEAE
ncbi:thiolase family protein [Mesorhizobium sp. YIM 152430]|uniref:thiolase family protein n=1 Tax=Mesorhizobium sp. YIM 152430 TaxID=3031761 RepID=UPI0023DBEB19|nr:thiolase family protein [Mesorhizobium sp. YIM 152430]MDF1600916.1 thiolase family protein [Mesorhizobium sp. YIM 152430]